MKRSGWKLCQFMLIAAFALPAATAANDTVYQWTDENGIVHYSDSAPDGGVEAQETTVSPLSEIGSVSPAGASAITTQEQMDDMEAQVAQHDGPDDPYFKQRCAEAHAMIKHLDSAAGVRVREDNGAIYELPDSQREGLKERAVLFRDEYCADYPPEPDYVRR